MQKSTSSYLDLIRFSAAVLVFTFHASYNRFDGAWLKGIGAFGHDSVMIFFVLSGFVIAYISTKKETSAYDYSLSRVSRLYSVAIPALILTLFLDFLGRSISPSMYTGIHYQDSEPALRLFANLFFINEIWFKSVRPFSNGPFWSLSYEFWYYVIYAAFFYFSGLKKAVFTTIAALIAGPKILLLLPVWLMGVAAFHLSVRITLTKPMALLFSIIPLIIYFLYRDIEAPKHLLKITIELLGRDFVYHDLKFSKEFINDYLVGFLVATHILGTITLLKNLSPPKPLDTIIKYFAGMTFALYLFHYPLLQFYGSITHNGVAIVSLTFLTVLLLAPHTEGKKKTWQRLISKLLRRIIRQHTKARRLSPF